MRYSLLVLCLFLFIGAMAQSCPVVSFTSSSNQANGGDNSFTFISTSTVTDGNMRYVWDFGDPASGDSNNVSFIVNPLHIFSGSGIFRVKLTVINELGGCVASLTKQITVGNGNSQAKQGCPIVDFTILPDASIPNKYTFISTSTVAAGSMSYQWDFGNGKTDTTANPTITYTSASNYTIKLVVTGQNGCEDSASKSITTCNKVAANFSITANNYCASSNVISVNNMSLNGTSATVTSTWNFGDGSTSTSLAATHSYTNAGTYTIMLINKNVFGACTSVDSISKTVTIAAIPKASYQLYLNNTLTDINNIKLCFDANADFSFISNSSIASGKMQYKWSFGSSNITYREPGDTNANARIRYNAAGTYIVKLAVTSDMGCKDSTSATFYLSKPVAAFTTNITPDVAGDIKRPTITFTDNSTDAGAIAKLNNVWACNQVPYTANTVRNLPLSPALFTPTPSKYARGGVYITQLQVTSDVGCVDTTSCTYSFYIRPVAVFSLNNTAINSLGQPVVAAATNTSSVDESQPALTYSWDFGDNTPALLTNASTLPSHTYTVGAASRTVTLTVTNTNGGLVGIATQIVNQLYIKPKAAFTANGITYNSNNQPVLTIATNTSTVAEANVTLSYSWNFGDNTPIVTTTSPIPPAHTYTVGAANRTVVLTVANSNGGLTDTMSVTLNNMYILPKAAFTTSAPTTNSNNQIVVGIATNTSAIADSTATLSYSWDFGDNTPIVTTTAIIPPAHIYTTGAARRTITLTVTSSNGNIVAAASQIVSNLYIRPTASFTYAPTTVGGQYTFTSTSTSNDATATLSYVWNFGDGTALNTSANPSHTFAAGGSYSVTLTVTSNVGGLVATTSQIVSFNVKPTANFTANLNYNGNLFSNPVLELNAASTTVNDVNASLTYSWNFGDGTTATGITKKHIFTTGGNKTVTLTVTNTNGGNTDVKTQVVNVVITPKAIIAVRDYGTYIGAYADMAPYNSSIVTGSIVSYTWTYSWVDLASNTEYGPYPLSGGTTFGFYKYDGFKIVLTLTVTSNLGISNMVRCEYGGSNDGGYTPCSANVTTKAVTPIDIPGPVLDVVKAWPNPATTTVQMTYVAVSNTTAIKIIDMQGRVVKLIQQTTVAGARNAAVLPVSELASGTYNIVVTNSIGKPIATSRFIKTN
ncbi:PKD domain-containing protein [Parasediminibacterium paludis]|uniref:PKD domain-containing protein n=1 Tax=Parasediminibacterium paludis TaxID=908966 RepID=A0ABV8PUP0_9BACT